MTIPNRAIKYRPTWCPEINAPQFWLISPAVNILEASDIIHLKADINRYVSSTISFLSNIREVRYRQNDSGYQIIEIVKFRLIPYS